MSETTSHPQETKSNISRRAFLRGAAAATAFSVVPRHVLGGAGFVAPSEKVNVAIIGTGGQGIVNMKQLFQEEDVRIAALCDINPVSDYSMCSYGTTDEVCPAASLIYFDVPARAGMGPVRINWYEGGMMPPRPARLLEGRRLGTNGIIYEGTRGGGWSQAPRLVPITRMREYEQPAKTLTRVPGHHRDWLNACKGQGPASTHFDYAGPLSEFVLMGNIALRSEKKLKVDWKNLKITNDEAANRMIRPEFDDASWMS